MTTLIDAVRYLELNAEVLMEGRWVRLEGERCHVNVVEMSHHRGFFTWCDDAAERAVQYHADPLEAITSGLRRAVQHTAQETDDPFGPGR